jgi:hypothetical protein
MVASWPHVRILACAVLLVVPSLPFLRHRVVTEDRVLIAELPVNGPLSMGRGISSLWGVRFSPLGGDGDRPFQRSGPPVFGARPRRLIGAVDD